MESSNKRINELAWKRTLLIRQEDRKEITKKIFDEAIKIVDAELLLLRKELVQSLEEENMKKSAEMEAKKMVGEKVVKVRKTKTNATGRKPRVVKNFSEASQTSLVAKALQMKSVKSIEKAAETAKSWNPELDEKKLRNVAKMIIVSTKAGKGRWRAFTWDEENFLLVPKA